MRHTLILFMFFLKAEFAIASDSSLVGEYHNRFNCINKNNKSCTKYLISADMHILRERSSKSYIVSISSKVYVHQQSEWVPYHCYLEANAIYKDGELNLLTETDTNDAPINNAKIIVKQDTLIVDTRHSEEVRYNCGVYADIDGLEFSRKRKFTIKEIDSLWPID